MTVYLDLTREFNEGALRAILSSGQAVVLHRLAVMSKDGDWILRETEEDLSHVLGVLERLRARYRFGAPLDVRWMRGGWSAHFEFTDASLRIRTDFVTRPPRLSPTDLAALWREQAGKPIPFVDARRLIALKKTDREKDYAVIGELARLIDDPETRLLESRSARDLASLAQSHAQLAETLVSRRPLLSLAGTGIPALERALDAERRELMHANEARIAAYLAAAERWKVLWPALERECRGLPLRAAHDRVLTRAAGTLPYEVTGGHS